MAATSQATVVSASYARTFAFNTTQWKLGRTRICPTRSIVRATSDDSDCNSEECAPEKEVGKVSMEWVAEDRTKVVGTFPPRKRGWTGYVEKDTAGQTNIYSVEPAVYIAETAISSGSPGSSADGSENTAALIAGLALISVAAAASILIQVGKSTPPPLQPARYSGPPLAYYINKLKPPQILSLDAPEVQPEPASASPPEPDSASPPESQFASPPEPSTPTQAPSLN